MKEFTRNEYKPKGLEDLKCAIKVFWKTLNPAVCTKYIDHIQTLIPAVIEKQEDLVVINKHICLLILMLFSTSIKKYGSTS